MSNSITEKTIESLRDNYTDEMWERFIYLCTIHTPELAARMPSLAQITLDSGLRYLRDNNYEEPYTSMDMDLALLNCREQFKNAKDSDEQTRVLAYVTGVVLIKSAVILGDL